MAGAFQAVRPVYLLQSFLRVKIDYSFVLRCQSRKLVSVLSRNTLVYKNYGCSRRYLATTGKITSLGVLASDDEKPKKRRRRRTKAEIENEALKESSCEKTSVETNNVKRETKTVNSEMELDKNTASEKPKRQLRKSKEEILTDGDDSVKPKRKRRSKKSEIDEEAQVHVVCSKDDKPTKKRKRKKKEVVEEEDETLEPSFPFEGTSLPDTDNNNNSKEYSAASDEFGTISNINRIRRMDTSCGRFYQITTATDELLYFPSVTTILKQTMSRDSFFRLHTWRKSMIKERGVKGFETYSREVKQTGTNFHQDLEARLLSKDSTQERADQASIQERAVPSTLQEHADSSHKTVGNSQKLLPSDIKTRSGFMQSVEHVLEDIGDVLVLEGTVTHRELGYTGTFDCVAKYRGELCLIDWKTSGKPRPSLSDCYEYPLQAAAYAGAINDDPLYSFKVYGALIVVVYPTGEPAHAHYLSHHDCLSYWKKWLKRLQEYQTQSAGDLSNVYVEI